MNLKRTFHNVKANQIFFFFFVPKSRRLKQKHELSATQRKLFCFYCFLFSVIFIRDINYAEAFKTIIVSDTCIKRASKEAEIEQVIRELELGRETVE